MVGGVVAQPVLGGQPNLRSAIVAQAGEGTILSVVLARFPGNSLFPMSLVTMNLILPDAEALLPSDLVGVMVVISTRLQQMSIPTPCRS